MKTFKAATLVLLMLCGGRVQLNGQETRQEYWQPIEPYRISLDANDAGVHELINRWNEIGRNPAASEDRLAGTYEKQGYRGYFLRWSAAKGFVYVFHSEGLSIIDFSYGKVQQTPDAILFAPEREMKETFRGEKLRTPREWIPITSGKAVFLVPKEQLSSFGEYVGGFGEYNDFNGPCCEFSPFFTRDEQLNKESLTTGITIPARYQSAIRRPIHAQIVFVGAQSVVTNYGLEGKLYSQLFLKASLLPVRINAGRNRRVKRNMLFRLIDQPEGRYLKITRVAARRALGVLIRDIDETDKKVRPGSNETLFPGIKIGTKVTTSPILDF